MTDHLPECHTSMIPDFHNERWICICDQLRACEQRVLKDLVPNLHLAEMQGYNRALTAAREAVNSMVIETAGNSAATVNQALAAIDLLRKDI